MLGAYPIGGQPIASQEPSSTGSVATAAGSSTAQAQSLFGSVAQATGSSTASAISGSIAQASGTSTANATPPSIGTAAGSSTANAIGLPTQQVSGGGWFDAAAETRYLLELIKSRQPVEVPKAAEIVKIIKRDNKQYYNAFTAKSKTVQRDIIKEVQAHLEQQDEEMLMQALFELF